MSGNAIDLNALKGILESQIEAVDLRGQSKGIFIYASHKGRSVEASLDESG